MKLLDFVVIGAGPAGSQVAFGLAKLGYRVVVLEQKNSLAASVCCTGIIGRECVESFAIDHSIVRRWLNGATVFSPGGDRITVSRSQPQACVVDRPALNIFLAERARAQGAEYHFASPVRGVKVADDGVIVETDGTGHIFETRAVVIASGAASNLFDGLGRKGDRDFVSGVQAEVATDTVDELEVYLGERLAPGFFAWLVPTSPGKALAGLICRDKPGHYLREFLAFLLSRKKILSEDVKPAFSLMPLKPLSRSYSDRLLVLGSAAGQVKPTTGGGIYYGLLSADLAVSCLHRALTADDLSAHYLAAYQRAWQKKLGKEIKTGYLARQLYESLSDEQLDRIFGVIKSSGIVSSLEQAEDLSFDWHSGAILKLLGHRLLFHALESLKIPPLLRGGVKKWR